MLTANIGAEGRKYAPYVFSLFMFILFANILGLLPIVVGGAIMGSDPKASVVNSFGQTWDVKVLSC